MNKNRDEANGPAEELELKALLQWCEFGCWSAIMMFPLLYWVNGPSVSTDQAVMRTILIVLTVAGASGLRLYHWRAGRHTREASKNSVQNSRPSDCSEIPHPEACDRSLAAGTPVLQTQSSDGM